MSQCDVELCDSHASFFVYQQTVPQVLATGEKEGSPAGRSTLTCGNHLAFCIRMLGTLPFRTNTPVQVTLNPR